MLSVGMIYFWFVKLEEDGLVMKEVDGCKMVYLIIDVGWFELVGCEGELGGIEDEFSDLV